MQEGKYSFKILRSIFLFSNLRWLYKVPFFVANLASSWSTSVVSINALPGLLKNALDLLEPIKGWHLLVARSSLHNGAWLGCWLVCSLSTILGCLTSFAWISGSWWCFRVVIAARWHSSRSWDVASLVLVVLCLRSLVIRLFRSRVLFTIWIHGDILDFKLVVLICLVSSRCVVKLVLWCGGLIT